MNWLLKVLVTSISLTIGASASAVTIDLAAGTGALNWDTTTSVASPLQNASVTHPLFPGNRHTHEGWFVHIQEFGVLLELTNFTSVSNGVSQDSISSTTTFLGETFELTLTYGLTAVGPDGLPQLDWTGSLSRMTPTSPFEFLTMRLFNVFDYDIGTVPGTDFATAGHMSNPDHTLIEIDGLDGISGSRGVYGFTGYTADTLPNVLNQIAINNTLNNTAASGNYDVAGRVRMALHPLQGQFASPMPGHRERLRPDGGLRQLRRPSGTFDRRPVRGWTSLVRGAPPPLEPIEHEGAA